MTDLVVAQFDLLNQQPQARAKRRSAPAYLAAIVLVGLTIGLPALVVAAQDHGRPSHHSSAGVALPTKPLIASAIDQAAVDYAASAGNGTAVSVSWVQTNMQAAIDMFNRGPNADSDQAGGPAVYAVVITGGSFILNAVPVPEGAAAPKGTVLDVIFSTNDLAWQGGGISSDSSYDLSALGVPETDSVADLKPMSTQEFTKKFGQTLMRRG